MICYWVSWWWGQGAWRVAGKNMIWSTFISLCEQKDQYNKTEFIFFLCWSLFHGFFLLSSWWLLRLCKALKGKPRGSTCNSCPLYKLTTTHKMQIHKGCQAAHTKRSYHQCSTPLQSMLHNDLSTVNMGAGCGLASHICCAWFLFSKLGNQSSIGTNNIHD